MANKMVKTILTGSLICLGGVPALAQDIAGNPPENQLTTISEVVEFSGLIEVELGYGEDYTGQKASAISLATVELGVDAQVNNWLNGHLLFLFEEGEDEDRLLVDEGSITISNAEKSPIYGLAGQIYVPFGNFESNFLADPLTLEIAETRASALQIGFEYSGANGSFFLFNGDINETNETNDHIDTFGMNAGYGLEMNAVSMNFGLSYLSNIGDTDSLGNAIKNSSASINKQIAGFGAYGTMSFGPIMVIIEYIGALDNFETAEISFNGNGAKPMAYSIELAYTMAIADLETTFAAGYQATDEALALELPETRILAAVQTAIFSNTTLGLQFARDEDYSLGGGTGKDTNTVTVQLALDF